MQTRELHVVVHDLAKAYRMLELLSQIDQQLTCSYVVSVTNLIDGYVTELNRIGSALFSRLLYSDDVRSATTGQVNSCSTRRRAA